MEAQSLYKVLRSIRGRLHHRQDGSPILEHVGELLHLADREMERLQDLMNPKPAPAQSLSARPQGLAGMNKAELWGLALRRFNVRLDINLGKEKMVELVQELIDEQVRPLEREIETRLRDEFGWRPEAGKVYTVDELMTLEVDYENFRPKHVREAVLEDLA